MSHLAAWCHVEVRSFHVTFPEPRNLASCSFSGFLYVAKSAVLRVLDDRVVFSIVFLVYAYVQMPIKDQLPSMPSVPRTRIYCRNRKRSIIASTCCIGPVCVMDRVAEVMTQDQALADAP